MRDFKEYIPLEKAENGYNLYPPEAVDVLRTIRQLIRNQNYSTRQVTHHLATGGAEVAAAVESPAVPIHAELEELKAMVQQLTERSERQEEFNRKLLETMERRDRQLTAYMDERRALIAESRKPKTFWQRLFDSSNKNHIDE